MHVFREKIIILLMTRLLQKAKIVHTENVKCTYTCQAISDYSSFIDVMEPLQKRKS